MSNGAPAKNEARVLEPMDWHAVLDALLRRDLFGVIRTDDELASLEKGAVSVTTKPYGLLLCRLLGYDPRVDEAEARAHWREAVAHRGELARRLGRPVHLRVAALDLVMAGRLPAAFGTPILVGPRVLGSAMAALTRDATGLLTRQAFLAAVERRLRIDGARVLAVVVGLEGLEALHDASGHAERDAAVARLGALVQERLSDAAMVGRLSGAEIGAAVGGDAAAAAVRVLGALCGELEEAASELGLDVAVGSVWAAQRETVAALVTRADAAMAVNRSARRAANARVRERELVAALARR